MIKGEEFYLLFYCNLSVQVSISLAGRVGQHNVIKPVILLQVVDSSFINLTLSEVFDSLVFIW